MENKVKTPLVLVSELTTNHKVHLDDNSWQKIRSISKGFYTNSKLLTYKDGRDSCLLNTDRIEAVLEKENE